MAGEKGTFIFFPWSLGKLHRSNIELVVDENRSKPSAGLEGVVVRVGL